MPTVSNLGQQSIISMQRNPISKPQGYQGLLSSYRGLQNPNDLASGNIPSRNAMPFSVASLMPGY